MNANKVWRTKDGREIPLREMTDEHLTNAMRFLVRSHRRYVDSVIFLDLPADTGELAREAAEEEREEAISSTVEEVYPIYDDMYLEAIRRGIIKSGVEIEKR